LLACLHCSLIDGLSILAKRRGKSSTKSPCGGDETPNFKATAENKSEACRSNVVTAVVEGGGPVVSVFVQRGHGERYVYHWAVLVVAVIMGSVRGTTFGMLCLDIACQVRRYM
jgi:hypothetical protein